MSESSPKSTVNRRHFAASAATLATAGLVAQQATSTFAADNDSAPAKPVNATTGKLKQSFCRWCFSKYSLEDLAIQAKQLGLVGIDLLGPEDFPTLKKHGLVCTMVNSSPLSDGLCDTKFHDQCLQKMNDAIEATSAEGWRNVICFSGNARGISREQGMSNCVDALKKIVGVAEKKKVILNMELLNSRVDHADYMCDNSEWGIELVKRVGSDNFKLLYDIYHMQIMEGDIIRSIEKNHQYFGHYHTAGNPGRHELDDKQELNYPAIARAVAGIPFDGYFVHEFIAVGDPMKGLSDAVQLCTV